MFTDRRGRRTRIAGQKDTHRMVGSCMRNNKKWIETRIEELAQIFAVGGGGFSVMDNHLHLLGAVI